jgi:hypothetical protein
MKNIIALTLLCLILFLSAIGCSDSINWLGGDLEYMEEIQDDKEDRDETKIFYIEDEEQDIDTDKDSEIEKRDVSGEIIKNYENERMKHIDTYKDSELEKRAEDGNKTYWENKQDSEF